MSGDDPSACTTCALGEAIREKAALVSGTCDCLVALAGNPNTGRARSSTG
jgi:hypothetical protein